jgi:signal transduction histidine kinase
VTQRKAAERAQRETEIMGRIVEAQESERLRIARDLHDHLGQKMTALRLKIGSIAASNDGAGSLADVVADAVNIDRDIGFLSWELRPTELEELGLDNSLSTYVREWSDQYGIAANFHSGTPMGKQTLDRIGRLPVPVETNLYRIVQEALNNVLKHAEAKNVDVLIQRDTENVSLIIEDDGTGFDPTKNGHRGLGLMGMNERAALLNGTCEIDSSPDGGTTVIVRVPGR